jgi:YD repeat-containing protein
MKKLLLFLLTALLFFTNMQAQPARLVMMTHRYWAYDTIRVAYKSGNNTTGDKDKFWLGTLLYDTATYTTDGVMMKRETITYSPQGERLTCVIEDSASVWRPFDYRYKHEYFYNANGDKAWDYLFYWNPNTLAWDSGGCFRYAYDTNNRLIEEVDSTDIIRRWLYTYDANGNLLSHEQQELYFTGWQPYVRTLYTYDAAGNNDTSYWQLSQTGGYKSLYRDINVYNGNLLVTKYSDNYDEAAGVWEKNMKQVHKYGIGDRKETDSGFLWKDAVGYEYWAYRNYQYNSLGQNIVVDSKGGWGNDRMTIAYNDDGWITQEKSNSSEMRYYYQVVPTESVAGAPSPVADITLYPNPARDVLQLRIVLKDSKPCMATIYDSNGRLLRQWQEKSSTTRTIPISDLQPGTYILTISNGSEKQSQQFVVAR